MLIASVCIVWELSLLKEDRALIASHQGHHDVCWPLDLFGYLQVCITFSNLFLWGRDHLNTSITNIKYFSPYWYKWHILEELLNEAAGGQAEHAVSQQVGDL